jgi:general secretion pathway protein N
LIRLALALIAALLAGVLAYQWSGWPPPSPSLGADGALPSDGGSGQASTEDPLARLGPPEDREAYASVIERPLFRPQRKPPEAEPDTPEPLPETQPAVDLVGLDLSAVVITPAVVSAWVRDNKAQELKRVRLGDELEGWAVKDILSDRLVLERQGERNELLLRDFSQAPPPVAPPPRARPTPAAQRMPQRPNQRPPQRIQNPQPPGRDQGVPPNEPAEPSPNGPTP